MSMHWAALLTNNGHDNTPHIDVPGLAVWALQFSPTWHKRSTRSGWR